MNETVQSEGVATPSDTSSVSEPETSTTENSNPVVDNSREESNTPTAQTGEIEVDNKNKPDLTEKSQNRFQEMANRIRDLETQNSQYNQYYQNPAAYPQTDPYAVKLAQLEGNMMIQQEQARLQNEQNLFREAEKLDPRIDPNSDSYDKDFDDSVTALYKAAGISPIDGVKKVSKLMEKSNYNAIQANEVSTENKRASSGSVQNRTANTESDEKRVVNDAYNRFKTSHTPEDYAEYLKTKRRMKAS